jgi:uncharacterized protein
MPCEYRWKHGHRGLLADKSHAKWERAVRDTVIFLAALAAGMVNSVSGGGTLIAFPALVWTGMDPVIANATNTVALWPGTIAALIARRDELHCDMRTMLVFGAPSVAGGLLGAIILIHTPAQIFRVVAPGLMLFASVILGAQELLGRNAERFASEDAEPSRRSWALVAGAIFMIAIYGGYFGAGIGILILAVLGMVGQTDIHRMIALRVFCSMSVNGIAALYFALYSSIDWRAAATMVVAQIVGGWVGASVSRNIDAVKLRRSIVAFGLMMSGLLLRMA